MWTDNETDRDFLNFSEVAKTVSDIVIGADNKPVSVGLSGSWGMGKSSLIKLIKNELEARPKIGNRKFLFVEFNAWLYQGYDDVRAALMEEIATKIKTAAKEDKTVIDKARKLLKRVNWLRTAGFIGRTTIPLLLGFPPVVLKPPSGMMKPEEETTPPKEIKAIRDDFAEILSELDTTLVVLIDDLDRCLPQTTISTLEAIRLFLFLDNTAFVIAADDEMIKHAVKKHFEGVTGDLVTNYFDKLIQVPIRVPRLGTQEVRAYLMLLFIENSKISEENKENLREKICQQLRLSWKGESVNISFLISLKVEIPKKLLLKLESIERLAPIMTSSNKIKGNPRLIKRFLNALSMRVAAAKLNGIKISEKAVAKMLLFERCGSVEVYDILLTEVMKAPDGKSKKLKELETSSKKNSASKREAPWNSSFINEWIKLEPKLGGVDLRGVLYLSREHKPLITPEDELSLQAVDLLQALLKSPKMANSLKADIDKLSPVELSRIMGKILEKADDEQEWGSPPILDACLLLARTGQLQAERFLAFLLELPKSKIKPSIVPKLSGEDWAKSLLNEWQLDAEIKINVKKAIEVNQNGNI